MKISTLLLLLITLLSGCASNIIVTVPSPPENKGEINVQLGIIDEQELQSATRIPETPVYYSQTEGGNAFFGILIGGGIGALINSALVENKTTKEAENSSIQIKQPDFYKMVANSINKSQKSNNVQSPVFFLEPFILIQSTKKEEFLISLVYFVIQKRNGETVWAERYFYHFNEKYQKNLLESSNGLHQEFNALMSNKLSKAMNELSKFVVADLSGERPNQQKIAFTTEYFGPLPGPYNGIFLAEKNGITFIRAKGNKTNLKGIYIRGMHIFKNTDLQISD